MDKKYLLINSRKHGFFSIFLHTLDRIIYSDLNNLIPVINWKKDNFLYYDSNLQNYKNCWEYYFENINDYNLSNIDLTNTIQCDDFTNPPIVEFCFRGYFGHKIDHEKFKQKRIFINKYISNIKIKKNIISKIENFKLKNFKNNKILGLHIRGTDRWTEFGKKIYSKFENYEYLLDEEMKNYDKLFICSDSEESIEYFSKKYNNVIFYDSYRTKKHAGESIHFNKGNYETGEQVLCESYLMSNCDKLIISDSNVTIASLYFNPNLSYKYINYKDLIL